MYGALIGIHLILEFDVIEGYLAQWNEFVCTRGLWRMSHELCVKL